VKVFVTVSLYLLVLVAAAVVTALFGFSARHRSPARIIGALILVVWALVTLISAAVML
jgi:multisubunit Na+/H+ antiporter MnhE subunit